MTQYLSVPPGEDAEQFMVAYFGVSLCSGCGHFVSHHVDSVYVTEGEVVINWSACSPRCGCEYALDVIADP